MKSLYIISCWFRVKSTDKPIHGLAICIDADTPETFIYPDGKPYTGQEIWDYQLIRNQPWSKMELNE